MHKCFYGKMLYAFLYVAERELVCILGYLWQKKLWIVNVAYSRVCEKVKKYIQSNLKLLGQLLLYKKRGNSVLK